MISISLKISNVALVSASPQKCRDFFSTVLSVIFSSEAGCELAVCEAQCVVGSVIRPVDPSLAPTYTHSEVCGRTAGPVWPTTPTSPLPLSGWDDRHMEQEGKREKGGGPYSALVALQMWLVWLAVRVQQTDRDILGKQRGCVYVS